MSTPTTEQLPATTEQLVSDYQRSSTMRAIGLTKRPSVGHVVDNMEVVTVPTPRPTPRQVAMKVMASSIDIDEINAAQGTALGRFFAPKHVSERHPHIMGSAASGVVVGVGAQVQHLRAGDEVTVIPDQKPGAESWATYRCVDQKRVIRKPASLSHHQLAATTLGACVAWSALKAGGIEPGMHAIVVGASGSIGSMMTGYLASLGCTVTGVGHGDEENLMRENGADHVVDYRELNFADFAVNTGRTADAVFDCVGGTEVERDGFRALGDRGVFVTVVGPMKYVGEKKLSRRTTANLIGSVLGRMATTRLAAKRYVFSATPPARVIDEALGRSIEYAILMPIAEVIPFELHTVQQAVEAVLNHQAMGRIVIDVDAERPQI